MRISRFAVIINVSLALGLITGLAWGQAEDFQESHKPMVEQLPEALFISPPLAGELRVMNVRVYDEQGQQVFSIRSFGEIVDIPVHDLEDGTYKYEAVAVVVDPNPSPQRLAMAEQPAGEVTRAIRNFGRFTVENGLILAEKRRAEKHDDGFSFNDIAGAVLGWLIPSAHAFDIVESDPAIFFKDTSTADPDGDWWFVGNNGAFQLFGDGPGLTSWKVFEFPWNSPDIAESLIVDSNGDIRLANSALFLDRSDSKLGIGTTTPSFNVDIHDSAPLIEFFDEDDSRVARIGRDFGAFRIYVPNADNTGINSVLDIFDGAPLGALQIDPNRVFVDHDLSVDNSASVRGSLNAGSIGIRTDPEVELDIHNINPTIRLLDTDDGTEGGMSFNAGTLQLNGMSGPVVSLDASAPSNSMTIDSFGNMAVGTNSPSNPLHVQRSDTARLLVENTTATEAPRELFEISNAGNTKFIITNTQAVDPSSWGFTNNGDDFRISYQGSGVVEMKVFQGGNVTIDGALTENSDRNAKTAIRALDQQAVLEKVQQLDIARWQYKDTPDVDHIGPMAQDFYQAFELGDSDKGIASLDTGGVVLASIQALAARNNELQQQNLELQARNEQLELQDQVLIAGHRELLSAYHTQQKELERLSRLEKDQARLRQQQIALQRQLSALIGNRQESIAMTRIQ